MKTFLPLITILLLISLAGNWIQLKSAQEQESWRTQDLERFQKEQSRKFGQIQARDSVIQALENKGVKDSIRHTSKQKSLISQANALKAKIKKGPLILQDTIIVYLDSLVADLQNDRDTIRIDSRAKIDSLNSSITDLHGLLQDQALRAAEAEGRLEREKSKDFTIGPTIGIDYRGKPTVSIGVTYRLWSFRLKRK